MAGANKSTSTNKQNPARDAKKGKKDKGESTGVRKAEITVMLNEQQAMKVIQNSKVVTVQDLARQTGVKISAANAFLKQATIKGTIKVSSTGHNNFHFIAIPKLLFSRDFYHTMKK